MDIWVEADVRNADKLVLVLRDFGFGNEELSSEIFLNPDKIIRMGIPPIRIEVMNTISGVEFHECYDKKIEEMWDGVKVNIISLDKLKKNKKATGLLKDLSDLEYL